MRVVIDTNVLLVISAPNSSYYPVFQAFINAEFEWCLSTETLLEYDEQLSLRHPDVRRNFIINSILDKKNAHFITPYYRWRLIHQDPDDDKFVDCAVAAGADYLVSNDRHYDVLRDIGFPPVNVMRLEAFMGRLGLVRPA